MRSCLRYAVASAFLTALACSSGNGGGTPGDGGVSRTVGPSGGTVSLAGGPSLAIPPGALGADTVITIRKSTAAAPAGALGDLYAFGPEGTQLSAPAAVSFSVPPGTTAAAVHWTKPGSTTEFDRLPTTLAAGTATAAVTHFSLGYVGAAAAATTYAVSGTVSGAWREAVTIALSGGGISRTAVTSAAGTYAFADLPDGVTYTLTPSLAGYTFTPASETVAVAGADATRDFASESTVPATQLGGSVAYAGAATGRIYVLAFDVSCGNCKPVGGTSLASPAAYPAPFAIRGLPPGTYRLVAYMDTLGTGLPNDAFPHGTSTATFTISATPGGGGEPGPSVTLADPPVPTLTAPANVKVFPGPGAALVFWDPHVNQFGQENVTGYRIGTGTDAAATNGPRFDIPATSGNPLIHSGSGVTDGATWYYKVAARLGGTVGPASSPVSAVIGAPAGGSSVTSSVAFPGVTASGPLLAGLFQPGPRRAPSDLRFLRVSAPSSGASYAVAGVPAGTWHPFALLDQNGNGIIDVGDLQTFGDRLPPAVSVPTESAVAQTLSGAAATAKASVQHAWDGGTTHLYGVGVRVLDGAKLPVAVVIFSGDGFRLPTDVTPASPREVFTSLGSTAPVAGATYRVRVTFSDGSAQDLAAPVTAIPDFFARDLAVDVGAPYSRTVPLFRWTAPASPPPSFEYSVAVHEIAGSTVWFYDSLLPSTATSLVYDADGFASQPSLTVATTYLWAVYAVDPDGNEAVAYSSYTP